jgi:pyruvate dehydrogenase E2 component (dihydrolipoamide acetyltransferase)
MGDFRMPSLGADMDEGTLLEWLVRPGDTVHRGDIVAVVDTAKSAVEVECFADGVVEALVVDPGQVVPVGGVLARLAENAPSPGPSGAATMKDAPPQDQPPEPQPPEPQPREPALPAVAPIAPSPLVRRRAHELGIDLTTIHGSGEGGVVIRQDIEVAATARSPGLACLRWPDGWPRLQGSTSRPCPAPGPVGRSVPTTSEG